MSPMVVYRFSLPLASTLTVSTFLGGTGLSLQRFDAESFDPLEMTPIVRQKCQVVVERSCANKAIKVADAPSSSP